MQQEQHSQSRPSGDASAPHDEHVGQKERHPYQIAQVENLVDKEAVNGCILADGCQQVGLDQHQRCLLGHKAHTKVKDEQEGDDVEYYVGLVGFGSRQPSEEGAQGDKLDGKDAHHQVAEELAVLVGLKHRVALLTQFGVLAQQEEQLYLIHNFQLPKVNDLRLGEIL